MARPLREVAGRSDPKLGGLQLDGASYQGVLVSMLRVPRLATVKRRTAMTGGEERSRARNQKRASRAVAARRWKGRMGFTK